MVCKRSHSACSNRTQGRGTESSSPYSYNRNISIRHCVQVINLKSFWFILFSIQNQVPNGLTRYLGADHYRLQTENCTKRITAVIRLPYPQSFGYHPLYWASDDAQYSCQVRSVLPSCTETTTPGEGGSMCTMWKVYLYATLSYRESGSINWWRAVVYFLQVWEACIVLQPFLRLTLFPGSILASVFVWSLRFLLHCLHHKWDSELSRYASVVSYCAEFDEKFMCENGKDHDGYGELMDFSLLDLDFTVEGLLIFTLDTP